MVETKNRLALALDYDDLVEALRVARRFKDYFGIVKVGLELYSATGPDAIGSMLDEGFSVFCDLKLYDIPTTVEKTAKVLGALGASYLTLHAHGGTQMLRAGVEGLCEGASSAQLSPPSALAVTVLTSDNAAPGHIVGDRVQIAKDSGCHGVICAGSDVENVKRLAPEFLTVVPGIRLADSTKDDQKRFSTPSDALGAGADILVIGRTVTKAKDPFAAAQRVVDEIEKSIN